MALISAHLQSPSPDLCRSLTSDDLCFSFPLSRRFVELLDRHTSSLMTFRMSNSWFTLRADELGVLMLTIISAVILLVPGASAAEAGLMLSLVYDTILIMPFLVMMCSELAAMLSAVDRCSEYCQVSDLSHEGTVR